MSASFSGRGYSSRPVKLNWVHVQEQQPLSKEAKFLVKMAQKPQAHNQIIGLFGDQSDYPCKSKPISLLI